MQGLEQCLLTPITDYCITLRQRLPLSAGWLPAGGHKPPARTHLLHLLWSAPIAGSSSAGCRQFISGSGLTGFDLSALTKALTWPNAALTRSNRSFGLVKTAAA